MDKERLKTKMKAIRSDICRGFERTAILATTVVMLNSCASFRKLSSDNEERGNFKEKIEQAAKQQRLEQAKADIKEVMKGNEQLYQAFCSQRSEEMSKEMLSFCADLHDQVKKYGRGVLQKRWGKNGEVPIGRHCLRSIVESMTECADSTANKEFINDFCQPLRRVNPNGCYGPLNMYHKDADLKHSCTMQQEIEAEAQKHPNDIFLVMHKSSQNNTNSGMHAVAVVGIDGEQFVISFNGEKIVPYKEYCAGRAERQDGYFINLSQKVAEGDYLKAEYAKFVDQTVEKAIAQSKEPKTLLEPEGNKKVLSLLEEFSRAQLNEAMIGQKNISLENIMSLSALQGNNGVFNYALNSNHSRSAEEISQELVKAATGHTRPQQHNRSDDKLLASVVRGHVQNRGRG